MADRPTMRADRSPGLPDNKHTGCGIFELKVDRARREETRLEESMAGTVARYSRELMTQRFLLVDRQVQIPGAQGSSHSSHLIHFPPPSQPSTSSQSHLQESPTNDPAPFALQNPAMISFPPIPSASHRPQLNIHPSGPIKSCSPSPCGSSAPCIHHKASSHHLTDPGKTQQRPTPYFPLRPPTSSLQTSITSPI